MSKVITAAAGLLAAGLLLAPGTASAAMIGAGVASQAPEAVTIVQYGYGRGYGGGYGRGYGGYGRGYGGGRRFFGGPRFGFGPRRGYGRGFGYGRGYGYGRRGFF